MLSFEKGYFCYSSFNCMFPYCETQFLSSLEKMSQLASIQPEYIQLVPMEHFESESDCGGKEKLKRIEFKMNKRNLK